ncbi:hypothetical protein O181_021847 [Austropuccinia psidii MF-1]|uniref:PIG-P domain-containing protein n=1 Tax=Austropuccinia psidii MF-1 TaxID=1389203 RepID=A0A9Q3CGB3_9BASI|nr:hypothetical protein [Austropuccinia psidii MF-1]
MPFAFLPAFDPQKLLPPPGTNALANSAFATYVLSLFGYLVYLLHGLLPPHVLHSLHITYYPSQTWSLILPAWLTVTVWHIYLAYAARNLMVTPPLHGTDGLQAITDDYALILPATSRSSPHSRLGTDLKNDEDPPVPILRDLPCQVVNEFYFG